MIRYAHGFSLIELMVVVAIVAILATIAYPSYQHYLLSNHRVEAKKMLLEAANRQEIYFMDFNQYAATAAAINLATLSDNSYYTLTITATTNSYTLSATTAGAQTADTECMIYMIDEIGITTAKNSSNTTNPDCWK